ncbi:MAG: PAS domain S-box protein [Candidatus Aminicenantes bacterium]|nr:PAS domain S-box protein [Candidatus Aminicenantes bacterium]
MPDQSQFFESIFNHVDSAIFVIDVTSQGKFIYVNNNRSHQQGLGVDKFFIKGKTPDDLVPLISKEYASAIKKNYQRCVKEKKPLQYDESFTVDEHKILVNTRLLPLVNKSGRVYRIIGISTYITERKQMEEALRASEEKYKTLIESSNDSIFIIKDGAIQYVNEELLRISGYSKKELIGQPFLNFVVPEERQKVKNYYLNRLAGKKVPDRYESKAIIKSGELLPVEVSVILIQYKGEKATQVILRDISARKKVEEELRLREQEISTITDNVPALVSYVDKDGYYRFINKQYKEWFGIPKKEILGKHYTQVLGKAAQKRIKDYIKKALSGKQVSYEEKLPYKLGGTRWVKADYVPDVDDEGDISGFFALVTDITDRKQTEKAIERHKQELQHLSSQLMHAQEEERQKISQELHDELGQMLTALSINLSSLDKLRTKEYDSQIRERLEESIQLVDTMSEQLNEMILNLRPSMLDDLGLIPTLRWYVKQFKDRNQSKVNLRVTPSKQQLTKDIETVLYRIIQEALTNTAKHAQAENVQVSINRRKASLKVTIQDDGQGFDAEKVSSLPVHEQGSGLTGMRERLLTVNGRLNISSKKGQGTRLDIIIPLGEKA